MLAADVSKVDHVSVVCSSPSHGHTPFPIRSQQPETPIWEGPRCSRSAGVRACVHFLMKTCRRCSAGHQGVEWPVVSRYRLDQTRRRGIWRWVDSAIFSSLTFLIFTCLSAAAVNGRSLSGQSVVTSSSDRYVAVPLAIIIVIMLMAWSVEMELDGTLYHARSRESSSGSNSFVEQRATP